MNFQDIIKFQLMSSMGTSITSGGIGGMQARGGIVNGQQRTGGLAIYDMLIQFIFMFLIGIIDDITKGVPTFMKSVQESISGFMNTKVKSAIETVNMTIDDQLTSKSVLLDKRHPTNSISMMRIYSQQDAGNTSTHISKPDNASDPTEMNIMVDAILSRVAGLDNIPTLRLNPNGKFLVSYKDKPIQITNDIFMRIDNIMTDNKTGHVNVIKITLLSNVLSACEISKYIQTVYAAYQEELKNSLGKNIYFFDHKIRDNGPPPMAVGKGAEEARNHKRMLIQTSPKQLSFTMTPFYSNKKFGNIFGTEVRKIQQRVEFFINNKSWYDAKGIPYQLGILLSGLPGTGKTSMIRAISNMTKRHIVNVNFANITTASQLKNLFYNDKLVVYNDSSMSDTKSYFIPIDQRLYVLEEIDAVGDIVKQRSSDTNLTSKEIVPDELTLGEILTVLDGTMEIPGRMIIMTSNHPEVLDKALLRPGRIDLKACFGNATRDLIIEMFEAYLESTYPDDRIQDLPDNLLTPAEVGEVLMKFCKSEFELDEIIDLLNDLANEKRPRLLPSPVIALEPLTVESLLPQTDQTTHVAPLNINITNISQTELQNEHPTPNNIPAQIPESIAYIKSRNINTRDLDIILDICRKIVDKGVATDSFILLVMKESRSTEDIINKLQTLSEACDIVNECKPDMMDVGNESQSKIPLLPLFQSILPQDVKDKYDTFQKFVGKVVFFRKDIKKTVKDVTQASHEIDVLFRSVIENLLKIDPSGKKASEEVKNAYEVLYPFIDWKYSLKKQDMTIWEEYPTTLGYVAHLLQTNVEMYCLSTQNALTFAFGMNAKQHIENIMMEIKNVAWTSMMREKHSTNAAIKDNMMYTTTLQHDTTLSSIHSSIVKIKVKAKLDDDKQKYNSFFEDNTLTTFNDGDGGGYGSFASANW